MARTRHVDDLLSRLAAEEARLLAGEFLAPAVRGGAAHVRLGGVVCRFRITGGFEGWGVFRPDGPATARLVRPATLAERRRYLGLLPRRRLILCEPGRAHWLAWPAHQADRRFPAGGPVPVFLAEEAQRFEMIEARGDGARYWFERLDERADAAAAAYLRRALADQAPPEQVRRPGLTAEQRAAYAFVVELRRQAERDRTEDRLRGAVAHAGAALRGYAEQGDAYRVEFEVDGRRHVAAVGRRDLAVQVAGICLSGEDRKFDLQSLVGVLREAHGGGVLPVGADNGGLDEDLYWQVHPPAE
jgi:hypothetical protein